MALLDQIATSLGGLESLEKASAAGDVLATVAVVIPAAGFWHHQWAYNFQAVSVANFSPSLLTVHAANPMSQAPTVGSGVTRVRGGMLRTFAARNNTLTVYGAPGATFDVTVYARPRVPASSRAGSGVFTRIVESQVPLGAGGTFNGAALDCGAGSTRFRGFGASDQAGTINMQQSPDGVNWFTTTSEPLTAGFTGGAVVESLTALRYVRVQVVNGGTPQTQFVCASSAVED